MVGGFSAGQGGRDSTFGSLIVGQYDEEGRLHYVTHVGSGFDDRTLGEVSRRLRELVMTECPFAETPPREGHPQATWVRPELVVEVEFSHWTRDGHLRAPVFRRLREDKAPEEIVRASAVATIRAPRAEVSPLFEPAASPAEAQATQVLDQLRDAGKSLTLQIEGQPLRLANLDKVLWPAYGEQRPLTKLDLLVYLATVSPWLLPQLRDRPVTLTRYPNGIEGPFFYQKHYEDAPEFVERIRAYSGSNVRDQTVPALQQPRRHCSGSARSPTSRCTPRSRASVPSPTATTSRREFTGSRAAGRVVAAELPGLRPLRPRPVHLPR